MAPLELPPPAERSWDGVETAGDAFVLDDGDVALARSTYAAEGG